MVNIVPSLLSADFMNLKKEIEKIENAHIERIHYDVMDGQFVNNISFGYGILKQISKSTSLIKDVHLMISDPLQYVDEFIDAGADILTFHYESYDTDKQRLDFIKKVKDKGIKVGMSIKPKTDVHVLDDYLQYLDLILLMSVEPGFGGQAFDSSAIDKCKYLSSRQNKFHYEIEVDGGINDQTISLMKNVGCDYFVVGSYFFKFNDYNECLRSLL